MSKMETILDKKYLYSFCDLILVRWTRSRRSRAVCSVSASQPRTQVVTQMMETRPRMIRKKATKRIISLKSSSWSLKVWLIEKPEVILLVSKRWLIERCS